MTLTRGKRIVLIVLSILVAWLVVWTILGAVELQHGSKVGPVTSKLVTLR